MYKVGTVGIVGPKQSVEKILDITREIETSLEYKPFVYKTTTEIKKIVLEFNDHIDSWFFSGPVPYLFAKNILGSNENLFYIPGTEFGLSKAILDFEYDQRELLDRVSIDFPRDMYPIEETLKQIEKPPKDIYLKSFDEHLVLEELVAFHYDLWKQGKTQGVITCLPSISEELRRLGVPAYWVTQSRSETRQALKLMVENMRSSYFKETQIGVEMIEVENFDRIINKMKSTYFLQRLQLRLTDILLSLCEKIDGSLSDRGSGRYVIFSSRGAIEREIPVLQNTILQMSAEADTTIAVGIGYGKTVLSAEMNAHYAMQQSKEKSEREIVIIKENGMIVELNGEEKNLSYFPRTDDKDLLAKLKSGKISIRTYKKIYALNQKMGWKQFTTKDLATYLQMTERNSRRIITDLCSVGLAICIGEEDLSTRGRPSKLYRLRSWADGIL